MSEAISKSGTLHIVATPIGNLKDITLRAQQVLAEVDIIAAEDTRHSSHLLSHLGISTPLIPLHEHNEASQAIVIIEKIKKGENVALISDAGTPLISDPGFRLIDLAHQKNIKIEPVPGPSAVMAALCASGIASSSFKFIGFLPSKTNQRRKVLESLKQESATIIFFESPHRIRGCVADLLDIFGRQRQAAFCRELTKQFETIYRASLVEIHDLVEADSNQSRGEIVIVVSGKTGHTEQSDSINHQRLLQSMLEFMPTKVAASTLAEATGQSRNYYYEMALDLKRRK